MELNTVWQAPAARPAGFPPARANCTRRSCIPQLISETASISPAAVAISFGVRGVTYSELEVQSNQLAGYLRAIGVTREVPVALCLMDPLDYIVAALAVWKAGGAYVPLDPDWPADVREWIVADSRAQVLIARGSIATRCRFLVDLDRDEPMILREEEAFHMSAIKRDRLASIVYRTGTGQPIGVELTHGNLLNLAFWHRRALGVSWGDRAAHLADFTSGAALLELWPFLTAGATIVAGNHVESPVDWIVEEHITMAYAEGEAAEALLAASWPAESELRVLLTGGMLSVDPAAALPFRVASTYGSLECSMVVTGLRAGEPIEGVQIHVLAADREPVAPGEAGEIYIGGAAVARGYRNRPDLNALHFFPNPFTRVDSARLYRTGEWGRMLPDGRVELRERI